MSELKPCPHCACEMEIIEVGRDWFRIKPVDGHDDNCPYGECHEFDCSQQNPEWKLEHIADWNKRQAEDALTEHLRLKEKECKQLQQDNEKLTGKIADMAPVVSQANQWREEHLRTSKLLTQSNKDKAELVSMLEVMSSFYGCSLKDDGINPETCQNYAEARALVEKHKCD